MPRVKKDQVKKEPVKKEIKKDIVKEPTKVKVQKKDYYYGVGKRKAAIAQVRLYPKAGEIIVNGQDWQKYFSYFELKQMVIAPLELTGKKESLSASVKVYGGGFKSQAEAVRHAITRALLVMDESLKSVLRSAGYVTRDPRVKERKKPGLKRARRAPQFSKR